MDQYKCECNKSYKFASGLAKHKEKCNFKTEPEPVKKSKKQELKELKELKEQELKEIKEQKIKEILKELKEGKQEALKQEALKEHKQKNDLKEKFKVLNELKELKQKQDEEEEDNKPDQEILDRIAEFERLYTSTVQLTFLEQQTLMQHFGIYAFECDKRHSKMLAKLKELSLMNKIYHETIQNLTAQQQASQLNGNTNNNYNNTNNNTYNINILMDKYSDAVIIGNILTNVIQNICNNTPCSGINNAIKHNSFS